MRYSKVIYYAPLALAVGAALAYLALYLLNVFYSPPEAGANTAPPGTYHIKEVGDDEISRVPGSGVRARGSGERETTASSLAGKEESSRKEDNGGQGKDGPAGAIAQGGNGR